MNQFGLNLDDNNRFRLHDAANWIAQDGQSPIRHQVMTAFHDLLFRGWEVGLNPQPLSQSITVMSRKLEKEGDSWKWNERFSVTCVIAFIEGIPMMGMSIALIMAAVHLFAMIHQSASLKTSVATWNQMKNHAITPDKKDAYAAQVIQRAANYTFHHQMFYNSLYSAIPFFKPFSRLYQQYQHHKLANNPAPVV